MKKHSLMWGAALLLLCNFFSKILGFIYRIFLVRIIGTEGIGLTEMVSPIYSFSLVVASLGLPLAMSRLISSQLGRGGYQNIQKIWRVGMSLLVLVAATTTAFIYCFAPLLIAKFVIDPRTLLCFKIIIPAIFIVTICSGYRAYFQATKQIAIIGFSQNIEQIIRVSVGIGLTYFLLPYGLEIAITAVSIATVLGEAAGLLYIMIMHRCYQDKNSAQPNLAGRKIISYLFQVGTPVTIQKLFMSFLLMLQAMLIPWGLSQGGLTVAQATAAYGNFAGVAMSLIHLPAIFTATLAMAILPAVAETAASFSLLNNRVNQSLHITTTISLPFMAIFYFYAQELCVWLFKAPSGGDSLKILALGTLFIYGQTTIAGILQGLGNVKALLYNLVISGGIFLAGIYILVPLPQLGIQGAAIAFVVFTIINCCLNLYYLIHKVGLKLQWALIIKKPLIALAIGVLALKGASYGLGGILASPQWLAFCSMGVFILVYLLALYFCKGLPKLFLKYFPKNF